jgi:NitT/TauT family transport system substrate-binding protein
MMRRLPVRLSVAASALAIFACLLACSRTDQKPAGLPEKVTVAMSATTDGVLAHVAQAKGFFRQEGVETVPRLFPYGKRALQEVLEGRADFATVAETPVMFAIMKGAKISIIATIQSSRKGNAIVARRDRGILTLHDLKGKRVGVTRGTTTDYFLDSVLAVNGIGHDDIRAVDLKAEEIIPALANGDVDAASTFNTYAYPAQRRLGGRAITFHDENVYTITFNIVATQEFVRNNPEAVKKLLRGLIRAEEFVKENPAETQRVAAEFSGVDAAALRDIWNETFFHVTLDQALVVALEDESAWAIKGGLTGGRTDVPNYLDFIYVGGLMSVKPKAVRILR